MGIAKLLGDLPSAKPAVGIVVAAGWSPWGWKRTRIPIGHQPHVAKSEQM